MHSRARFPTHRFSPVMSSRSSIALSSAVIWMLAVPVGCAPEPGSDTNPALQPQATWTPLFNGTSLQGWEQVGAGAWTVDDGEIVVRRRPGETGSSWLVTRKDYGDFKLRLKFRTPNQDFNSGILVRDPGHAKVFRPAFNGYEIQVAQLEDASEPNTNGAIYDLARAFFTRIAPDEWVEFEIHASGDHIVSFLNGEKMAETHSRRSYKGAIGLQLHGGKDALELRWKDIEILELPEAVRDFQLLEEQLEQAPGEIVDLLKGKTLEDFEVYWDGGATWTLENGVLRGEAPEAISWIFTPEAYADFVLAFDFRISAGGNAGVCIRLPWPQDDARETGPARLGYECQIQEEGKGNSTGSIYNIARAYTTDPWHRPIHRRNGWNHYRIYAKGDHLVTYVNGRRTAQAHVTRSARGRLGFQVHEPAQWVEYRNVTVKVINE